MHVEQQARYLLIFVVMYLTLIIQLPCTTSTISKATLLAAGAKQKHAVIRFLWAEGVRGVEILPHTISIAE
jgi:hypothetical protein